MERTRAVAILCQLHAVIEKNDAISDLINRIENSSPPVSDEEVVVLAREGFRYLDLSKLTDEQRCHFCDLARRLHEELTGESVVCNIECPLFIHYGTANLSPGESYFFL